YRRVLLAFRPVVLVLENADHTSALAAAVLLHLEQDRISFGELGARRVLVVEHEELAVLAVHVVPESLVVLVLDLEAHGGLVIANGCFAPPRCAPRSADASRTARTTATDRRCRTPSWPRAARPDARRPGGAAH